MNFSSAQKEARKKKGKGVRENERKKKEIKLYYMVTVSAIDNTLLKNS